MLRFSVCVWILWLLQTGASSDDDVSGCQRRPCQNGGVCQSHNGGFRCLCSRQSQHGVLYGGATCSTALSGCDGNQCENGGVCSALLSDGAHTYRCVCPAGFTGPTCQTSTVFSFESEGYVRVGGPLPDPEAPLNVTFGFRSARPYGTLLQRQVGDLLLSIELLDGRLRLRSRRGRGPSALVQELPESLSSSRWYVVAASLGATGGFIRLVCPEGGCTSNPAADVQQPEPPSGPPAPGASRQSLTLGAAGGLWGSGGAPGEADRPPAFLGCFRDVLVGPRLVLPGGPDAPANVTAGCSDRDRCGEGPCQNRGRCLSRGWRSYTCQCHRPYEGRNCEEESITARFGNQDLQSYAVFSLDDDPGHALTVSMFVRTRRPGGLLLVLANSTGQYLRLWLEGGRVRVQVNNLETLAGRGVVSDGHFHLVTVRLAAGEAELFQSSQSQGSVPIRPVQAQPGDLVSVGGLPQPRAAAAFGGYFRGCVQDLRLNRKRLQFYPTATRVESYKLERLVNVQQGCSSSDACTVNPCLHGGACYSVWDSFVCSCPPNTAGQRCEEVGWCELSPCPATAECQPRPQGFECLSNVTFGVESSVLRFRSNGRINRRLSSVSLSVRTRRPDTILLHGQRGRDRLTVSLLDSRLVVELHAGAGRDPPRVTIQSRRPLSDGKWHTVELRMEDWTRPQSRWIMAVDSGERDLTISQAEAVNLDFLGEGADLFLGGRGPDARLTLSGCLGPVEIGGLLLPVHHDSELNLPRPQVERFERMSGGPTPPYGCRGSRVCEPNPCRNQGTCDDLFDLHRCSCPSAWTGPLCEASTDACVSHPCLHGNCTDLLGGFQCVCEPGYGGDRCEAVVDACENSYCGNGSTCLKGVESYSCLCPQNATGQYCDEKIPDVPWYIEINPLPQLPVSTCAGTKRNYSCFHGGNCSETDSSCSCRPGFTGQWCEKDVDECASHPCMNGGFCINYVNSFECVCDMNYSGTHCQIDVSDFYLYVFLGLWQNLFQLMSYLLIRLDDQPEVDWGFYVND